MNGTASIVLALSTLLGCTEGSTLRSKSERFHEVSCGATAAVEGTYASYGQLGDQMVIVVWSDLPAVRVRSGVSEDATEFRGVHQGADQEFDWQGVVTSEREGLVRVNGQSFQLAEGHLFLASFRDGKPVIQQLEHQIHQYNDNDMVESLRGWLRTDDAIQQFFQAAPLAQPSNALE